MSILISSFPVTSLDYSQWVVSWTVAIRQKWNDGSSDQNLENFSTVGHSHQVVVNFIIIIFTYLEYYNENI